MALKVSSSVRSTNDELVPACQSNHALNLGIQEEQEEKNEKLTILQWFAFRMILGKFKKRIPVFHFGAKIWQYNKYIYIYIYIYVDI